MTGADARPGAVPEPQTGDDPVTSPARALLADIGGPNTRLALLEDGVIRDIRIERTGGNTGLAQTLRAYLDGREIAAAALAVAAPVDTSPIRFTNADWSFTRDEITDAVGTGNIAIVNDFAAQALALPHLQAAELVKTGGGEIAPDRPKAVLGPGTGLGVAALLPSAGGWRPLTTEAGHMTLAAVNAEEDALIARLRREYDHVSAERVLSGHGLTLLYHALADLSGEHVPAGPRDAMRGGITPDRITAAAHDGSDPLAARTIEFFCRFLGTVAADAALAYGATGGVYIAGGIVPRLGPLFASSGFRDRFERKGRFSELLRTVPTFVVTAEYPAFAGLKALTEASDQA